MRYRRQPIRGRLECGHVPRGEAIHRPSSLSHSSVLSTPAQPLASAIATGFPGPATLCRAAGHVAIWPTHRTRHSNAPPPWSASSVLDRAEPMRPSIFARRLFDPSTSSRTFAPCRLVESLREGRGRPASPVHYLPMEESTNGQGLDKTTRTVSSNPVSIAWTRMATGESTGMPGGAF